MDAKWYTSVMVGVLALGALTAAVVLEVTGNDASHAWQGFAGLAVFFAGVHVPSPAQG